MHRATFPSSGSSRSPSRSDSESSAVALTDGAPGAVSIEATVTVEDAAEVWVSGVFALSVTCNSKVYVSPAVSVLPGMSQVTVAPAEAPVPLLTAHWVVATYVPPFTDTHHSHA